MHWRSSTSTEHLSIFTGAAGWVEAAMEQRVSVTWWAQWLVVTEDVLGLGLTC